MTTPDWQSPSAILYPNTVNLKRTHPRLTRKPFNFWLAPPLPKIDGDLLLEVLTHRSLRRQTLDDSPEDYGDNERLAELGKSALEAMATHALFRRRPLLKASEISLERESVLSDENIDDWVTFYNLRKKLRCHPDVFQSLASPQETRSIFYAYVGGVCVNSGPEAVESWINGLLGQNTDRHISEKRCESADGIQLETPPPKRLKSEPPNESFSELFASSSPVQHAPVQPSPPSTIHNPLAPAQPNLAFLPLFNQTATQRRVTVEYPAEFNGPAHAGQWTVQCVVNGIPKGVGKGGSKQVAKEEAARQAYYSMGWT